jgi:23S rRNA (uracil1939-C5)-methyltransferase
MMKRPEKTRPAPTPRQAPAAAAIELTILHLAAGGDGAARLDDGSVIHVPFALPGERVRAIPDGPGHARLEAVLSASPDRVTPPCPHFGSCGGCALQHLADGAYAAWKQDRLRHALARAGYPDANVAALRRTPPGTRRRMDFCAQRISGGILFGLHAAGTKTVIDIDTCPVLHPSLVALLPALRTSLTGLAGLRHSADVAINLLDTGPDILIRADGPPAPTDRAKLADFCRAHDVARIAWAQGAGQPEIVAQIAAPAISYAGVSVSPPPGAFLQAAPAGEAAIVASVRAGLPGKLTRRSRIIELYAGIGTLCFPLATAAPVTAYEGNAAAHAVLSRAAGGTRVTPVLRDLVRQPLQIKELAGAAAVVLDPPFAGAAAQMPTLAASKVAVIIYVSCNPAALTRDAAVLHAAGYALATATPIDQFLWSAQVESVAVFTR